MGSAERSASPLRAPVLSVWACDVVADELEETRALCASAGGDGAVCEVRVVDVRDKHAVDTFVAEVFAATGRIDVLVNNAGGVLGQIGRPIEDISPADWQAIFDVNVSGAFYFSQAVTPAMKDARSGRIVNISSGAGLGISLTGIQAYASAKAAQIGSDATARARAGAVGHYRQQHRAGVRALERGD